MGCSVDIGIFTLQLQFRLMNLLSMTGHDIFYSSLVVRFTMRNISVRCFILQDQQFLEQINTTCTEGLKMYRNYMCEAKAEKMKKLAIHKPNRFDSIKFNKNWIGCHLQDKIKLNMNM